MAANLRTFARHWPALAAAAVLFAFALVQGLTTRHARDFFIFRLGAELALHGQNPYDVPLIRSHVAAAYPDDDKNTREFVDNCGYFLPPQAIVVFLPSAAMPRSAAAACWSIALGLAALAVGLLPERLRGNNSPPPGALGRLLTPFVLVLNPLVLVSVFVGQMSLLVTGCVAAGLWCLERRHAYLAAVLWTLPFMKPHVAIPLLPLLAYLGGWRPVALLVVLVAFLNLAGATIVGGTPLFLVDYLNSLSAAHKTVGYNRVESNPGITSWNCLLYRCGGPLVELSATTTIASYAVWFGLIAGRVALTGRRPPAAWVVAVAAVGSVFCAQVLRYELVGLVLLTPWLRDLFTAGRTQDRIVAWLAVGLMAVQLVPEPTLVMIGITPPPSSFWVALLAALVVAGPWPAAAAGTETTGASPGS